MSKKWRCFHCDEVFTSVNTAAAHFGWAEHYLPGCVEKVNGGEFRLLRRVRELQDELAAFFSETDAVESYIHGLKADHAIALRKAEENGYNKGVQDARKYVE